MRVELRSGDGGARHRRLCSGCSRQSYAFTLIELLVVVGIIAILVAMLLPTLQRARIQAQKVSCLSNMRQTILALQMYGVQYRDYPWNVMPGFDISVYNISNDPGRIYKTPAEIATNATTSVVPVTYR